MKKTVILLTISFLALFCANGFAETGPETRAAQIIEAFFSGDAQFVFENADSQARHAFENVGGVNAARARFTTSFGSFRGKYTVVGAQENSSFFSIEMRLLFADAQVTMLVKIGSDALLQGFVITSVSRAASYLSADMGYIEETVLLREGETDESEALLTLPQGEGPFPTVIIMQGAGTPDRDGTSGNYKYFQQIARTLAAYGIGSIRYDKYSRVHPEKFLAAPTETLEYENDAQAAFSILRTDSRVGKIFLFGYSQGATLLSRVARTLGAAQISGGIMVSGTPLHLWNVQHLRVETALAQLPRITRSVGGVLLRLQAAKIDALESLPEETLARETVFSYPALYQLDDISADAAEIAVENGFPLLITQGGKDTMVPPSMGIDAWKTALADYPSVTYAFYENMNHMLYDLEGEATGTQKDYENPKPVSSDLIADIAGWILAQ